MKKTIISSKSISLAAALAIVGLAPSLAQAFNFRHLAADEPASTTTTDAGYGSLAHHLKQSLSTPDPAETRKPTPIQPTLSTLARPKAATKSAVATANKASTNPSA